MNVNTIGLEVLDAYTPSDALVATMEQVVGVEAERVLVRILHSELGVVRDKVMAPLPEPPVINIFTGVPTGLVSWVFEIERSCCACLKLKTTGDEETSEKTPSDSFVAVTEHDVDALTVSLLPEILQLLPVTANVKFPFPEPPEVLTATSCPTSGVIFVLVIRNGA